MWGGALSLIARPVLPPPQKNTLVHFCVQWGCVESPKSPGCPQRHTSDICQQQLGILSNQAPPPAFASLPETTSWGQHTHTHERARWHASTSTFVAVVCVLRRGTFGGLATNLFGNDMTFRRLKMVESSGPDSAAASLPDNDVYFPSSQSDSCQRTAPLKNDSSEVYNYKTLAYSGGTLPRNLRKVKYCNHLLKDLNGCQLSAA